MRQLVLCPVSVGLLFIVSCGPVPDPRGSAPSDLHPPVVESVCSTGPSEISITFDEEASLSATTVKITPALQVSEIVPQGVSILVRSEVQTPGLVYTFEGEAQDKSGNVASFMAEFYGFNPRVPLLLVNEFTPRGTTDHPDLVEIKVTSRGRHGRRRSLPGHSRKL